MSGKKFLYRRNIKLKWVSSIKEEYQNLHNNTYLNKIKKSLHWFYQKVGLVASSFLNTAKDIYTSNESTINKTKLTWNIYLKCNTGM